MSFKLMLAVCTGIAVGAAIGAIAAPEKLRRRMRNNLKKSWNDCIDELKVNIQGEESNEPLKDSDLGTTDLINF